MNLRDLEYLIALDELRHFRKAAEKCYVSQPTLSGQLKKLEQELGVQLVERTRHRVFLTPVGQEIVNKARRIMQEVEYIQELAQMAGDPLRGPLRIGLIPTLGPYLLPLIIPAIRKGLPGLELYLHEIQTADLLKRLASGELDVGILALPIESEQMQIRSLFEEHFWLAVPENHLLALQKNVKLRQLAQETILLLDDGHCLRDQALDVCTMAGAREKANFRGTSLETLKHMVSSGNGITLMPELAILTPEPESSQIRYLPFENPAPAREIGLIYRKSSPRKNCFDKLAKIIQVAVKLKI
ncbi:DNA-binding transcriptional regulator OxyR [bacterium (Candidatus Blackallbacteria) CG17_big_fil_post_rev_8_21_14_2_50_48_46]|uniref:DNA-binding transcriptional regulator OxyR n=1 Tax=bacterium (Candidatus Blackallbacteria) CG17_big_fil_post_rev_8_21_14_2_50_48_46 TaxID=2014261 RepID=A0A2M7G348_9BACT|nr:MAG: DNA-binding transcriptional regulator OxyR [bacterium (Candidatus Blackallbacteria) CG18_big_fil_WC_8_21_14_2_50_49_26]PIW16239.1 MAG: DNA-binding transcriptional regulator OxyR [bacterium (Candidatus Blackallbacteria) CG17_big_fil_post_rev_8_21_14_2_50_48_46]PIW49945.1 MAG: DNA-binding transcriptional regulator OxyR [bacterium (Candidatus Blackallbacteria) CG13_big_fil_rev_8_21_14_2_50_49_14]